MSAVVHSGEVRSRSPLAVVGMSALFPGALNVDEFWANSVAGISAFREAPEDRIPKVFVDAAATGAEGIYGNIGAFVDEGLTVNIEDLGLSPRAARAMEPDQVIALALADEALSDAGDLLQTVPRERIGVVLGKGGYVAPAGIRLTNYLRGSRQLEASLHDIFPTISSDEIKEVVRQFRESISVGDGSDAVGLVSNLSSARIAGHFDLRGGSWTTDAACASSIVALDTAMSQLALGSVDAMVVGAVHHCHDVSFWNVFCRMGAMSRRGCVRPFDEKGDGLLIGEGSAMFVVERLESAIASGRRIHAVIEGVGVSSDGASGTPVRPGSQGQVLAMRRAWREAGVSPSDASFMLYEAHGTGTPVGDAVELGSLIELVGQPAHEITISTAKSFIGHAMPAAGAAGLIRAIGATRDGILLPSVVPSTPLPKLGAGLTIRRTAQAWESDGHVRRAGVSAFGFGGVNGHVVVSQPPVRTATPERHSPLEIASRSRYAFRLRARSRQEAIEQLRRMTVAEIMSQPAGATWGEGPVKVSVVDPTDERIDMLVKGLEEQHGAWAVPGICFVDQMVYGSGSPVVGVFPGLEGGPVDGEDGPQYDWREHARAVLEESWVESEVLRTAGVVFDDVVGSSIGELNALHFAGAVDVDDKHPEFVQRLIGTVPAPETGYILIVADRESTLPLLEGLEHTCLSHDNAPNQCLVGGPDRELEVVAKRARAERLMIRRIDLRSGFHTPAAGRYIHGLRRAFGAMTWTNTDTPVWSSASASQYEIENASEQLASAITRPVRFRETIEALYANGARVFVQVGRGTANSLIDSILGDRHHICAQLRPSSASLAEDVFWVKELMWCLGKDEGVPARRGRFSIAGRCPQGPFDVKLDLGTPLSHIRRREDGFGESSARTALSDSTATQRTSDVITVSTRTMPFLLDHCFYRQAPRWPDLQDRWPVVPGTTILDLARHVLEQRYQGRRVVGFRDVRFISWLPAEPEQQVELRVDDGDDGWIHVRFGEHASVSARIARRYDTCDDAAPEIPETWARCELTAGELYSKRILFHGPSFQGVTRIGPIGPDGIAGRIRPSDVPGAVMDCMGQIFGYWLIASQTNNTRMLPAAIDAVEFFGDIPSSGDDLDCHVNIVDLRDDVVIADIILSQGRRIVCRARGWTDRRFDNSPTTQAVENWPELHALSRVQVGGWVACAEPWSNLASRQMTMRNYLGSPERRYYEALPAVRQRHWLLGRIAAKDAVRDLLWQEVAEPIFPAQISVLPGEDGCPEVHGRYGFANAEGVTVSIAHVAGLAVALARRDDGVMVGIDVDVCAARSVEQMKLGWSSIERGLVLRAQEAYPETDWWTVTWCAKEAVSKAHRTGLMPSPRSFVITRIDPGGRRLAVVPPNNGHETVVHWTVMTSVQAGLPDGPDRYVVAWTGGRDLRHVTA
ncbi:Acyl transferase domain-containing protein [Actinomyces denticolens]|uniref:Acyl transferase domain-containing protein n=1 Tax=Actinomyces denticolens TaxID=52767 RepID=A0ABY1IKF2_9ACTO|nr:MULTISPECIES: beta-ketoacyl synthase N-terminal-like domain-containing protein [Actinomyces]SHJ30445.1 Acyl transferase domain-containing protein [Actinomyces denticolens]SUU07682.1 Beta-ketoacyl-acyl-carrier-protein synthase I [Actinomyces denticolens]